MTPPTMTEVEIADAVAFRGEHERRLCPHSRHAIEELACEEDQGASCGPKTR